METTYNNWIERISSGQASAVEMYRLTQNLIDVVYAQYAQLALLSPYNGVMDMPEYNDYFERAEYWIIAMMSVGSAAQEYLDNPSVKNLARVQELAETVKDQEIYRFALARILFLDALGFTAEEREMILDADA